jgi:hypothetical protein
MLPANLLAQESAPHRRLPVLPTPAPSGGVLGGILGPLGSGG